MFRIRCRDGEQTIPPGKITGICLHPASLISYEAVAIAVEHDIDILFCGRDGFPFARIWSPRFGSVSTIRKNQLAFAQSEESVQWVKDILLRKLDNQIALVHLIASQSAEAEKAAAGVVSFLEKQKEKLCAEKHLSKNEAFAFFRSVEGAAGRAYFGFISSALPHQYRFERRSKHPAHDMFNAMLNYAYGMLYGKVEAALIKAGIDPCIGVMHRDEYNRPVLVYDFIEQFRHWADFTVFSLCSRQVMFREFFRVEGDAWWLDTYGKRILIQAFNDYLEELAEMNGLSRSRHVHIGLEAARFASLLKNFNEL